MSPKTVNQSCFRDVNRINFRKHDSWLPDFDTLAYFEVFFFLKKCFRNQLWKKYPFTIKIMKTLQAWLTLSFFFKNTNLRLLLLLLVEVLNSIISMGPLFKFLRCDSQLLDLGDYSAEVFIIFLWSIHLNIHIQILFVCVHHMYVFMQVCTYVHAGLFLINSSVTDVHHCAWHLYIC